jgi:hypothetical protein
VGVTVVEEFGEKDFMRAEEEFRVRVRVPFTRMWTIRTTRLVRKSRAISNE